MRIRILLMSVGALVLAGVAIPYSGVFNVAADDPHWDITLRVLELTRDRSIAARARDVTVPPLEDAQLVALGAHHYDEMCSDCHLEPGDADSELRAGLYPQPPDFSRDAQRLPPNEAFWVVKHGLKMTGMPAWGRTHDDRSLWGLVAFLQKLPQMTEEEYKTLTRDSGGGHGRGRGRGGSNDDQDEHGGKDDDHAHDEPHHH